MDLIAHRPSLGILLAKKEVLKLRSNSSIVIAAARTGKERIRRIVVTTIDQQNNERFLYVWPLLIMFIIVTKKLIDLRMLDTPARWSEKIAQSTDGPACARFLERGG